MAAAYYTVTLNIISLFCIWFHPRYHVLNKLALKGLVNVTHKPTTLQSVGHWCQLVTSYSYAFVKIGLFNEQVKKRQKSCHQTASPRRQVVNERCEKSS